MGQKQSQIVYCDCIPNHDCPKPPNCKLHSEYVANYKAIIPITGDVKKGEADKFFGIWWGANGWAPLQTVKKGDKWLYTCYACHRCIGTKRRAANIEYSELGFTYKP